MASSAAALLRRVRTIERKLSPPQAPREWEVLLETGEELSDELLAQVGKYDQVFIRYYPAGYMPEAVNSGQIMACWVPGGPRGQKRPMVIRQYDVDLSRV